MVIGVREAVPEGALAQAAVADLIVDGQIFEGIGDRIEDVA